MALPLSAHAAATAAPDAREFDRVQVTATRTERALSDVAATVDVIDREQMDRHLVQDIRIWCATSRACRSPAARPLRHGWFPHPWHGRQPRAHPDRRHRHADPVRHRFVRQFNRNFTDLDTLKRVEIVRGPASSLYGSDALGGVVAFVTKDPADYLKDGKNSYFGLKFGYDGEWKGLLGGATAAFGGDHWSGLVSVNHHQGEETDNKGMVRSDNDTRTASIRRIATAAACSANWSMHPARTSASA